MRIKRETNENRNQRLYNKNGYIIADIPILLYIYTLLYMYIEIYLLLSPIYI